MFSDGRLLIGKGEKEVYLEPKMANRHGLIAGATGTGKTITLKVMAESFSDMGVPVFLADIKGDLGGCVKKGAENENITKRLDSIGISRDEFIFTGYPVRFWDVFGEGGHPVRTTVSEMGSTLLSRLLGLTDVQSGVMDIVFRVADDKGWLLIDYKELLNDYGNVTKQSVGAIQRSLLRLEDEGAEAFFGEPSIDISDWIQTNEKGQGYINILHCVKLYHSPLLYSTFMLWLLSELFETLPEVGDLEKPKLVFFFDEAHLLFKGAPTALVDKIEQVVKLIRSKGVGVYFITQSPSDVPDTVLAQLSNRVQHALRAYTPSEQRAVRAAAQTFRPNPAFSTETAITELATGQALVSFLDAKGVPGIVEKAMILPPQSAMGPIDDERRRAEIEADDLYGKYEDEVDNESAYEIINAEREAMLQEEIAAAKEQQKKAAGGAKEKKPTSGGRKKKTAAERMADQAMNTIGREIGKSISRGLLGSLKKFM